MKTGKLEVKHGVLGGAKDRKGRSVFLGKAARRAQTVMLRTWFMFSPKKNRMREA
jgi:hypothetical protein